MKAYSLDLRQRVLADCDAGMKTRPVAAKYSVSESWVRRLKQQRRETGSIDRRPPSKGAPVKLAPHEREVRDLVKADPDATLQELRGRLSIRVSVGALAGFLRRIGISFKKKSSTPPSRSGPTSRRPARSGRRGSRSWAWSGWCSSTSPGPAPT